MKARTRIIHVVHSFETGGMEKGVATLIRHSSADMSHALICLTKAGSTARLLPEHTEIIELHKPEGNSFSFLLGFAKLLKDLNPDLIHTRNWAGTDGILAARLAGIRTIVHSEHGFGSENITGKNKKRIWIYRFLSPFVNEYICVSPALAKWLDETVRVRKPVQQICNGVDTDYYKPGKNSYRVELRIPPKSFVIGIVASLYPIKNHVILIRAFERLRCAYPDTYLLIVGDGAERGKLEAISPPGVVFLGNRQDISRILQTLDVFVLCSLNEGISNTILEAMATGLPVVASNVGGNPNLVLDGVTGRLFPSGDVEALSDRIFEYLTSPDQRFSHGKRGRDIVLKHYDIQSMVNQYERVWRRVAASH